MRTLISGLLAWMLSVQCLAADGPENSGTLTIGNVFNKQITANFQVDRKVFNAAPSVAQLFVVTVGKVPCTPTQDAVIESADVLTASLVFVCAQDPHVLTISLQNAETLPDSFSLGVRSPIDHFVLTKTSPVVKTIINSGYAFGLAGLTLFFNHSILEKTHIGRPHAFFFGGLTVVPAGFYFLLVFTALWLTAVSLKIKWAMSIVALLLVTGVAAYTIKIQGSLSFLPVNILGIMYLGGTAAVLLAGFCKPSTKVRFGSLSLITVGFLLSGFEFAIMLRWLEGQDTGQETMNKSLIVGYFFCGLAMSLAILATVASVITHQMKKGSRYIVPAAFAIKIAALTGTLYTLTALIFKLP